MLTCIINWIMLARVVNIYGIYGCVEGLEIWTNRDLAAWVGAIAKATLYHSTTTGIITIWHAPNYCKPVINVAVSSYSKRVWDANIPTTCFTWTAIIAIPDDCTNIPSTKHETKTIIWNTIYLMSSRLHVSKDLLFFFLLTHVIISV